MIELIYIVGMLLSSLVSVSILFDFMEKSFERTYKNKLIYSMVKMLFVLVLAGVNAINNPWLNLTTVIVCSEIIGLKMYAGKKKRIFLCNIIIVISLVICETMGIILIYYINNKYNITLSSEKMKSIFDITFTEIFVIFIYHLVLLHVWLKKDIRDITRKQYFLSFIYAIFCLINVCILFVLVKDSSSRIEIIMVLITLVGIVITNAHFLNFLEYASKNNRLLYENNLFIQQSRIQYQYYDTLEQQYRESLCILHDANRHIRSIEELYRNGENKTAIEYIKDINMIMDTFKRNEYTENRVLNVILNDKMRQAEHNNIKLTCRIDDIDMSFIDNIDLTTIFANLIDNAIEACLVLKGEKLIIVQVGAFNNLIIINIKNSMEETPIDIGVNMKSSKKNHSGIGIPNVKKVVNKYNGDFNIQREENMFVCNIVISKQGRSE